MNNLYHIHIIHPLIHSYPPLFSRFERVIHSYPHHRVYSFSRTLDLMLSRAWKPFSLGCASLRISFPASELLSFISGRRPPFKTDLVSALHNCPQGGHHHVHSGSRLRSLGNLPRSSQLTSVAGSGLQIAWFISGRVFAKAATINS